MRHCRNAYLRNAPECLACLRTLCTNRGGPEIFWNDEQRCQRLECLRVRGPFIRGYVEARALWSEQYRDLPCKSCPSKDIITRQAHQPKDTKPAQQLFQSHGYLRPPANCRFPEIIFYWKPPAPTPPKLGKLPTAL